MCWDKPLAECTDPKHKGSGVFRTVDGELVRIEGREPHVDVFDCFVGNGYFSENLGGYVGSRSEKRALMKAQGVRELEQGEKPPSKPKPNRRAELEAALPFGY